MFVGEPTTDPVAGAGRAWYVVQTKRYRERVAQEFLAQRTVASYLPRIVLWPRPAVGNSIAPMFPGYLFIVTDLAQQFSQILRTPGVKAFVSFGGGPVSVPEGIIEFLRGRQGADGLIRCDQGIAESSEIRIVQGPFRGLTAIVEERLPARERVRVLLELLQRTTRVELPERWIRQA